MVIAPLPVPAFGKRGRGTWIPQPLRLLAAVVYLGVFLALGAWAVNDKLPPPVDLTGLWFWGALLPLTISRLIMEPFFSRPADAITNSLTVIAAAAAINVSAAAAPADQVALAQRALIGLALLVLALSAVAIAFKDLRGRVATVAFQASRIVSLAGRGAVLYSLYLLLVSWAAFATSSERAATVGLLWVFVLVAPFERIAVRLPARGEPATEVWVEGMLDPRILVIRAGAGTALRVGAEVSWPSGARGHIVDVTSLLPEPRASVGLLGSAVPATGEAGVIGGPDRDVVGWVGSGTNSAELKVRFRDEEPGRLREGRILSADIDRVPVVFQLIDAEILGVDEAGLRRQVLVGTARKLGLWDAEDRGFRLVPWVADAGSPVRLVREVDDQLQIEGIGRLPGTNYQIGFNTRRALIYNTAILGILGVGKSSLAFELIYRTLAEGLRVIVLDITGEYERWFRPLFPTAVAEAMFERVEAAIAPTRLRRRSNADETGNEPAFSAAVRDLLGRFFDSDSRLLIVNPQLFDVKASSGMYPERGSGTFALRTLTVVDVTRVIAEALLEEVARRYPADPTAAVEPHVCFVLEEAHSLVPERNSYAATGEGEATAGTARALLQGRKYGLGTLLITQRTANVTKTILNQCHTVFAMRSFDTSSEEFLENYIGREFASVLSSLDERQAVLFGRGSTSESPVLIDLNNRERFRDEIWPTLGPIPATNLEPPAQAPPAADAAAQAEPDEDELPF
jgi:uncharacterized protein